MKILHALLTFIGTMLLHWENLQNVSMYMYWCPFQSRKKQWVQAQTRMMSIQNINTSLLDFLNLKNCSKLTIRNTLHVTILKDKYCNILQYGFYWRYPILINLYIQAQFTTIYNMSYWCTSKFMDAFIEQKKKHLSSLLYNYIKRNARNSIFSKCRDTQIMLRWHTGVVTGITLKQNNDNNWIESRRQLISMCVLASFNLIVFPRDKSYYTCSLWCLKETFQVLFRLWGI